VVSFTSRPLYPPEKNPRYQVDRRLGGPQRRSGSGEYCLYIIVPVYSAYNRKGGQRYTASGKVSLSFNLEAVSSIRNPRTRHAVVSWTHITIIMKNNHCEMKTTN
jgi:hypothetical protein